MSEVKVNLLAWERLKRKLKKVDNVALKVGILKGQGAEVDRDGITMAELAAIHEFGSPKSGIPERRPIRASLQAVKSKVIQHLAESAREIIRAKKSMIGVLQQAGDKTVELMQEHIRGGKLKPKLAPATVRRKGSTIPLVDTGALVDSISAKVEKDRS